jgi:hypothetical protein
MNTIEDLYAGDAAGLREVTCRFLEKLELLKTQAPNWLQQQNWELLHRHTHQAKATAALYGLPDVCRLLNEISGQTHTPPVHAQALETPVNQLPAAIAAAMEAIQKKLDHVS